MTTFNQAVQDLATQAQLGDSRAAEILAIVAADELKQERHAVQAAMVDNAPQWETLATGDMFEVTHLARWRDGDTVAPEVIDTVDVDHAPAVTRELGAHATASIGPTSAVRDTPVAPMTDAGHVAVRSSEAHIMASPASVHRTEVVNSAVMCHDVQRHDVQTAVAQVLTPQQRPAVPFHADKLAAAEAARQTELDKLAMPWLWKADRKRGSLRSAQGFNAARKRMLDGLA